ncbi:hypothetical protein FXO38_14273 [Capsicum annuum]|uniref:Retrotransposon gag domain-containing protein n=1 Tax=Capsicum annuum TaxID=4072 RepID=A0A2G2YCJ2_CAPAN|nr:hypothetical protein FXO38_14273 [Capsicum annuum]PHT67468.1 hypothetical protein T459_26955 [Capsicum annuum]
MATSGLVDLANEFVQQFQYNVELIPDEKSLTNMKKKSTETFREYVIRWHEQVARVKPSMKESKIVESHPQTPQTYQSPSRSDFQSKPNNEMGQKSRDIFTPIGESYASLFQRLDYSIEDCRSLKREIEKMIQDISIMVQTIDNEESSSHANKQTSD